ncbi:hypothetical protein HYPSUDRAFT_324374 [Hypholoma sublateritium FD-334 SS-4]|uniref:Methylated-DNA--protein-cysteine methyltransferase n=1 Tax=Hypholoma sublateritium (strain FD-334 SS-4) TaxID=945553 RepID=A0A0D2KNA9_HYPSF|nr:hypothetical protein HYPSUDRAFT_324374 [Hypholoma sublateritium FD-334 SS-4]
MATLRKHPQHRRPLPAHPKYISPRQPAIERRTGRSSERQLIFILLPCLNLTLDQRLTPHQWDVYDFVLTIPKGKVATYKDVALSAGGSPRSVGNALRNNPFSPSVPCHRVIASSLFIGGFFGEWGKDHKTGKRYNQKLDMLAAEGVAFNDKGHLLCERETLL